MRQSKNRGAALLLAGLLCLGLTACGGGEKSTKGFTTYDAQVYVDGLIKENYMGKANTAYLELVEINESDVQNLYANALAQDANYFFFMYDIDNPSDELQQEVMDMYREIYQYTKYEIVSATEQEDGSFSVKLNIYPIDIVQTVNEAQNVAVAEFHKKYPQAEVNAMRDEEYQAMAKEWEDLIMGLYKDALKEIGNMTEKSISILIEQNSEGYYAINKDDFARLDALIIDYTNMVASEV